MSELKHIGYCNTCEHAWDTQDGRISPFWCPVCGSEETIQVTYLKCDCGEEFELMGFTNECPKCGKLYNGFGQELADPGEWDEQDRYDCFGPQDDD